MPYRIKEGQEVLLEFRAGEANIVSLNRTVDFELNEMLGSPLTEHGQAGIPVSPRTAWPWAFDVRGKWAAGSGAKAVTKLFAKEVHSIMPKTNKETKTVVVPGSRNNQYTVTVNDTGVPVSCSCPAFRFRRNDCKHMDQVRYGLV